MMEWCVCVCVCACVCVCVCVCVLCKLANSDFEQLAVHRTESQQRGPLMALHKNEQSELF